MVGHFLPHFKDEKAILIQAFFKVEFPINNSVQVQFESPSIDIVILSMILFIPPTILDDIFD